jgi:glucose/mannose-6-phosphate isomerase
MSMRQAILDFPKQFAYEPVIEHTDQRGSLSYALLVGMGGSHLAADILKAWDPSTMLYAHSNYGLPPWSAEHLKMSLLIASSYSGNTEEVLDAYDHAGKQGMHRVALATGGALIDRAKHDGVPYVQLPDTGIQPRSALGFSLMALITILRMGKARDEAALLATTLDASAHETDGKELAEKLGGLVPVICASPENATIAYNWKIKFNETGKSPAVYSVFPELNHNEMTGFDRRDSSSPPSDKFAFVFLRDTEDHPRVQKRMEITAKLYSERGFAVHTISLDGDVRFARIFNALLFADWTALAIANQYGLESEQVPMVEEFKKLIT